MIMAARIFLNRSIGLCMKFVQNLLPVNFVWVYETSWQCKGTTLSERDQITAKVYSTGHS